jgi:endo-1,3(4)-beta-glucanase
MSLPFFDSNTKKVADSGAASCESSCISSLDSKTSCERRSLVLTILAVSLIALSFALIFALVRSSNNDNQKEDDKPQIFLVSVLPPSVVCDAFYCSAMKKDSFEQNVSSDCDCASFADSNVSTISNLFSIGSNNSLFHCIDHPTVCTNHTIRSFVPTEPGNPQQQHEPSHMKKLQDQHQPIPTNVWWGNLIHPVPAEDVYKSYPVFPHPYMIQYKFHSNDFMDSSSAESYLYGVHLSHLPPYRIFGPSPDPGKGSANGTLYMYHWYTTDIIVSALDIVHPNNDDEVFSTSTANADYVVTDWDRDGFGVTVKIDIESDESNSEKFMQMTLVQGMALVTTEYRNCIPTLQLGHTSSIIYESDAKNKWIVEMDITHFNSANVTKQHWVIYADPPIEWKQEELLQGQKWVAMTESYSGVLRMAKLPDSASNILTEQLPKSTTENGANTAASQDFTPIFNLYDPYRSCIVNGGSVHLPLVEATDDIFQDYYMIQWLTASPCQNGILHFGLPHQASIIHLYQGQNVDSDTAVYLNFLMESPTRGMMQAYVSLSGIWRLHAGRKTRRSFEDNADMDLRGVFLPDTMLTSVDEIESIDLLSLLNAEIIVDDWSTPKDSSYYFNGKAVQKFATLCLLANQTLSISRADLSGKIGDWNSTALEGLFDRCMYKLGDIMDTFIGNSWTYPLVYDEVFKGIVSSQGYVDVNNTLADFGNTFYNDHHYHWGYWIVASSIYLQLSPYQSQNSSTLQSGQMDALINIVNGLIRDVANPAPNDAYFPMYRNFNWFYGHSLASGIFPSVDGKNQESISEEMNFHYGVYLWGFVTRNRVLEHLGQVLLNVNALSIQTYFLFTRDNPVHPFPLRLNKVTGIMFDSKIQYGTWFCDLPECIHGIQMLPVSPVTSMFRSRKFIQEEWDDVLSKIPVYGDNPSSSWISLISVNLAHVNATFSLSKLRNDVTNYDNGLSKSWAMYYARTCALEEAMV